MKIVGTAIIVSLSFFYLNCFSSDINREDKLEKYQIALQYIKNDHIAISFISDYDSTKKEQLSVLISPTIIPPAVDYFTSFAIENKMNFKLNGSNFNYNNSLIDSLSKFEKNMRHIPYENKSVTCLSDEQKADAIIFLSKAYDNFLTATLFYNSNHEDIAKLPYYQASLNYLIIFNSNKIDKVLTQIMDN